MDSSCFFQKIIILGSHFFSFLAVIQVSGLLGKLGEAPGINFHQGASKSELVGPRYVHFRVFQTPTPPSPIPPPSHGCCWQCLLIYRRPPKIRSNFNTRELNTRDSMFLKNTKINMARSHELGFGRPLVEIDPRSLPKLFQQPRDLDNSQGAETLRPQNL